MKKTLILLAAILLLAAGCSYSSSALPPSTATPSVPVTAGDNSSPALGINNSLLTNQKFSDQDYYSYSYLISGDTLSADAQTALTGFTLNKQVLVDGNTQIGLTSTNPEYKSQEYILKPGEQLYFIEKNLGDDQDGQEGNLADDTAVVVDSSGYVVQAPVSGVNNK